MSYDKSTQPLYKGNKINQTLKKAGKWTNQNVDKKMITEKKKNYIERNAWKNYLSYNQILKKNN